MTCRRGVGIPSCPVALGRELKRGLPLTEGARQQWGSGLSMMPIMLYPQIVYKGPSPSPPVFTLLESNTHRSLRYPCVFRSIFILLLSLYMTFWRRAVMCFSRMTFGVVKARDCLSHTRANGCDVVWRAASSLFNSVYFFHFRNGTRINSFPLVLLY